MFSKIWGGLSQPGPYKNPEITKSNLQGFKSEVSKRGWREGAGD